MSDNLDGGLHLWVEERFQELLALRYRASKTLYSQRSPFQQVDVIETVGFGKMLFNDGLAMVSERDEFVYHDMIAHVPLFVHPNPRRVLVIGGGDGGTVREVIRHQSVEHCHLVEIDACVVEACRQHIPLTSSALSDSRVKVSIADGVEYLAQTEERYDVILVDSTDPIGPAAPLFGSEFYRDVFRALHEQGIVVSQCESSFYFMDSQKSLLKTLRPIFPKVHLYNYSNLTYPGGLWSFSFASKGLCPVRDFSVQRVKKSGLEFSYYNSGIHRAAFSLPEFQRRAVSEFCNEFCDSLPE